MSTFRAKQMCPSSGHNLGFHHPPVEMRNEPRSPSVLNLPEQYEPTLGIRQREIGVSDVSWGFHHRCIRLACASSTTCRQ